MSYEEKTQKEFGEILEQEAKLDQEIELLEEILAKNETYQTLLEKKEERDHLWDSFKKRKLREFEKRNIKTVEGSYGKVTMRVSSTYKVVDEKLVPKRFFKESVDMDKIKREYLLNKSVDGIRRTIHRSMLVTPKRIEEEEE